ncbi:glycosyl hydrolase family 2 protein [Flindersiella endophytica]
MKRRTLMKLSAALAVTPLGRCATPQAVGGAANRAQNWGDRLERGFLEPPNTAKPRAWWFWGDGNVTQEGIKKDLEWMKRVGFGGFMRADFAMGTPQIVERVGVMSPQWMDDIRYATKLADQLGFHMGTSATPGWSASGGPWVPPSQGMKKFVWTETRVEGGEPFRGKLAHPPTVIGPFQNLDIKDAPGGAELNLPDPWYADAAVMAYRLPDSDESLAGLQPKVTSSGGDFDLAKLTDGDYANGTLLPPAPVGEKSWIQLEFEKPVTVRGLSIYLGDLDRGMLTMPGQSSGQTLEVSDDGKQFRVIAELPGLRLSSFVLDYSVGACTISFAPVTAKFFRIAILARQMGPSAPQATNISELTLHTSGWVNRLEEKTAAFSTPPNTYEMTTPAVTADAVVHKEDVIDLTSTMEPDGTLNWTPPAGKWAVLRLGCSLVGTMNRGTTPEATGLEVDKLSKSAVQAYYDYYLDKFEQATGGLMGERGLNYLHNDNWERGQANWTDEMIAEFTKRRGYDMKPWLPVLVGHVVESSEASDRFLWDFRRTIAEMTAEYTYDQVSDILNRRGMGRYSQGHEFYRQYVVDGMDVKRTATVPMGVAWAGNPVGEEPPHNEDVREAASVAHIYGQNLVVAETFPAEPGEDGSDAYAFSPERLKPAADVAFADGVNRIDYEATPHQPVDDKIPGLAHAYGQWFTRHETWAEYAEPWITYLARSSHLLQQGRAVADVLYYYGEDSNITALFGDQGPDVPEGYALDYASSDVILNRIDVTNGRITTRSGMSYRLLVLDDNAVHLPLNVLKKIRQLVTAGASVAGPKPTDSPSNSDNQAELKSIADPLWGTGKGTRKVGKGQVFAGQSAADALHALQVSPDFEHTKPRSDTALAYAHRKISDGDIYFVHNRKNRAENVDVTFRLAGKAPELWNAVTGEINPAAYRVANGRTTVPLNLDPSEAVFVVFRKPGSPHGRTLPQVTETPAGTIDGSWTVAFQPNRGAPASITLDRLSAWNDHPDPGVKYFSGTATYTKTIHAPAEWFAPGSKLMLDLGSVKNIAEVTVNGESAGVLWTPPFQADITGALKPGTNTLEIKVTNLWPNRLIGDLQPNTTKKYTWTSLNVLRADSPLLPSGLLGPVRVLRTSSN